MRRRFTSPARPVTAQGLETNVASHLPETSDQTPGNVLVRSQNRRHRIRRAGSLLLLAALLTIGQVTLATLSGRGDSWHDRYLSLWTWDGGWYADIVNNGYRATSPPGAGQQYNVAFFPGYPVTAGIVSRCFGLSAGVALLLTSQTSALVFWFTLLLLLERWQVARSACVAVVMLLFCQPGAYYFVVSYSESLFFAAFLLLFYFGPRAAHSWPALVAACLAGYVMSATRILGAPLAVLPAVWAYNDLAIARKAARTKRALIEILSRHALVSAMIAAGTLSFFAYCAVRFGHWNEYMRAGEIGWFGNHPDYHAIFSLRYFRLRMPRFYEEYLSHGDVTSLYIPFLSLALVTLIGMDLWLSFRRRLSSFAERIPLYIAAVGLFLICVSSGVNPSTPNPVGFIRYGLYTSIPIILALGHAYRSSKWRVIELPLWSQLSIFALSTLGLAVQLQLCWRYARAVFIA